MMHSNFLGDILQDRGAAIPRNYHLGLTPIELPHSDLLTILPHFDWLTFIQVWGVAIPKDSRFGFVFLLNLPPQIQNAQSFPELCRGFPVGLGRSQLPPQYS